MKRVGIVTFHRAFNYGAALQAYALQHVLEEKCYSKIIDYRSPSIESKYYDDKRLKSIVKNQVKWVLRRDEMRLRFIRKKNYISFQNQFMKTSKAFTYDNIKTTNNQYDIFITGSDQVWNSEIVKTDLNYFLRFAEPIKRRCYAASFGNESILSSSNIDEIRELISSIKDPLLREEEGFEILRKLDTKNYSEARLVCDPVFLMDKEQWINGLGLKEKKDNYIFIYIVAPSNNALKIAKNLSEITGFSVRYCNAEGSCKDVPPWCEDAMSLNVVEFVETILNARYIVTTSFHGMAFSILFNKDFYYELKHSGRSTNNSRLINLSRVFKLDNREIISCEIPTMDKIQYSKINPILEEYRSNSRKLLFDTILM